MSEELIKNISLNFPHQEYEENLIILGKDGSLSVLNNTSKFLYENCDNQSVHTLTKIMALFLILPLDDSFVLIYNEIITMIGIQKQRSGKWK